MDIIIKNFGPIKEVHCDLSKDTIVFTGKNNTGKSYAASLIYLLLKNMLTMDYPVFPALIRKQFDEQSWLPILEDIWDGKKTELTWEVNEILTNVFQEILADKLQISLENTYGELNKLHFHLDAKEATIHVKLEELVFSFTISDVVKIELCLLNKPVYGQLTKAGRAYQVNEENCMIYLNVEEELTKFDALLPAFLDYILRSTFDRVKADFGAVYFLPASRCGLYLAATASFPYPPKPGDFSIAEPISDYISWLQKVLTNAQPAANAALDDIVQFIEENILHGTVFLHKENHRLFYEPADTNSAFAMTAVSAAIFALSLLTIVIQNIAPPGAGEKQSNPGNEGRISQVTLFLEDLETHLHPGTLEQLLEVLGKLPAAGIKLITTTHDNLFVKGRNAPVSHRGMTSRHPYIVDFDDHPGEMASLKK